MMYMSKWVRRSNVLTGAEWMDTRFSKGRGLDLSRIAVLVVALVGTIGFLSYAFQGVGKFSSVFFPFDLSPEMYALIIMSITTTYVVAGGMYSVVFTDVIQFVILTIISVVIGVIAMDKVSPDMIAAIVPDGWGNFFFGSRLGLDWASTLPAVTERISDDGFEFFSIIVMAFLFKGVLISMAGPTPGYDMQRSLAAKSPKQANMMSAIVTFCTVPRWFMVAGVCTLALAFYMPEMQAAGPNLDFELILPWVISEFLPVGLVGLLLAGLLAAFMSTFDSTVNSGAAYLVNDLYKEYFRPNESNKTYIRASYLASFLVVAVGIAFGFMADNINSITQWIVSGLYGGYTAPNLLKWHWWKLNGKGYFAGMISGISSSLLYSAGGIVAPETFSLSALEFFPFLLAISTIFTILVSLKTDPDDEETLLAFYKNVRPWGFWGPIREKAIAEGLEDPQRDFSRDATNVFVGLIWQMALIVAPILLVVFNYKGAGIALAVLIITSWFLKKNWYDAMEEN